MTKKPRIIDKGAARKSLAARVAAALTKAGVDAVLVGGSVVSIYSDERYVTDDLDFVSYKPLKVIAPVLEQLGWKMVGNRATHPKHELYVQFCAPPLADMEVYFEVYRARQAALPRCSTMSGRGRALGDAVRT